VKPLHLWSAGVDRAAMAIPPSPEQVALEKELEAARATYGAVVKEVSAKERERVARELFTDPESVGLVVIAAGSPRALEIEAAEQRVRAIQRRIAVLEADRDFKIRAWRDKHGM
jgi:hypothetical protein